MQRTIRSSGPALGLALGLSLGLLLGPSPAAAQPKVPPPTLQRVLGDSIVGKARVRWSRGSAGARVEVSIGVGAAERLNPQWSPEPVRLRYDLNQNQLLEREIKRGRFGASTPISTGPEDRTLELLARGAEGWVVVGTWSMPAARWKKQHGPLFRLLEPLFEAPAEPFVNRVGTRPTP
jgi:hypothetical protein